MASTITVEIPIRTKGERSYFQVNIPLSAMRITGIEGFVTKLNLPGGRKNLDGNVAGTIKLQAENREGLSFITQLWVGDHPVEQLLPGIGSVNDQLVPLFPAPYYFNLYDEKACSRVIDSYMLYGCYQDILGVQSNVDARYLVTLCLYLEQR